MPKVTHSTLRSCTLYGRETFHVDADGVLHCPDGSELSDAQAAHFEKIPGYTVKAIGAGDTPPEESAPREAGTGQWPWGRRALVDAETAPTEPEQIKTAQDAEPEAPTNTDAALEPDQDLLARFDKLHHSRKRKIAGALDPKFLESFEGDTVTAQARACVASFMAHAPHQVSNLLAQYE